MNRMERALLHNILKVYGIGICHAFQLILPVFVPLLLGKGLSMSEILQTQAIFALTVAMFEVPSGYLADVYGRKVTLIASAVLMLLGYACLYSAQTFTDFLVFEVVMGVALSLSSGSDMAMLFDSQLALQKLNSKFKLPATVGRLVAFTSLSEGIAAIVASVLFLVLDVELAFEWILALQLLFGLPPLIITLTLVEPPRTIKSSSHQENARSIATTLIYGDRLVLWIAVATVVFGLFAMFAFWTYQRFWELEGVPIEYFGYLWAVHCILRGVAAQFASRLEGWIGSKPLLALAAAMPAAGFLGMASLSGWAAVACALIFPISRGLNAVVLFDSLNSRVDSAFRATINSVLNLAIRAVFIVAGPLLGLAIDELGMNATLLLLSASAAPLLGFATFMLLRVLQFQRKSEPDIESINRAEQLGTD